MESEKDVLDFLDSLPAETAKKTDATESDKDILEFLDQLEETDAKKKEKTVKDQPKKADTAPAPAAVPEEEAPASDAAPAAAPAASESVESALELEQTVEAARQAAAQAAAQAATAATQAFSSWWSQATATVQKTSQAIQQFKPEDTQQFMDKGIDLISNVIQTINFRDEIIHIHLVHDINIDIVSHSLRAIIKDSFTQVMSEQVDGKIEVRISESSTPQATESNSVLNWNMFQGKSIDVEKLSAANIKAAVKDNGETEEKITNLYISIVPYTTSSNEEIDSDLTEPISSISSNSFTFFTKLEDINHNIIISANSQPLPLKWSKWLKNDYTDEESKSLDQIDPKDWIEKWIIQTLDTNIGIIAQSYIIKRMGY